MVMVVVRILMICYAVFILADRKNIFWEPTP
jgi:hypothetical protein